MHDLCMSEWYIFIADIPVYYGDFILVTLTNHSGFKIDEDSAWHVLAGTSLAEEGIEGIVTTPDGLVAGHLTVRLDAMLETVELPAAITDLDAGLTDVHGDTLTHFCCWRATTVKSSLDF